MDPTLVNLQAILDSDVFQSQSYEYRIGMLSARVEMLLTEMTTTIFSEEHLTKCAEEYNFLLMYEDGKAAIMQMKLDGRFDKYNFLFEPNKGRSI